VDVTYTVIGTSIEIAYSSTRVSVITVHCNVCVYVLYYEYVLLVSQRYVASRFKRAAAKYISYLLLFYITRARSTIYLFTALVLYLYVLVHVLVSPLLYSWLAHFRNEYNKQKIRSKEIFGHCLGCPQSCYTLIFKAASLLLACFSSRLFLELTG
jgi:CDP-diglyceride synthetase